MAWAIKAFVTEARKDKPKRILDLVLELTEEDTARFLATKELLIERTSPNIRILVLLHGHKHPAKDLAELERIAKL